MTRVPLCVGLGLFCMLGIAASEPPPENYSLAEVIEQSERIRQLKAACGPLSLARAANLLGKPLTFDEASRLFPVKNERGVPLADLVAASKQLFPEFRALHVSSNNFSVLPIPSILIVAGGSHCVVFEGMDHRSGHPVIWDPARLESAPVQSVEALAWTGDAIVSHQLLTPYWIQILLVLVSIVNVLALALFIGFMIRSKKIAASSA